MLTPEENDLISRTGRGTLMGDLFRRFWTPMLLASELPSPDCPPVRVRLLGEDLVAFKDSVSNEPMISVPPVPGRVTAERTIAEIGVTEWTLSNGVRVVLKPTDYKADEIGMVAISPGGTSLVSDAQAFVAENAGIAIDVGGVGAFDQVAVRQRCPGTMAP